MTIAPIIEAETPRALHAMHEVTVLRAAVRDGKLPQALRQRTATLLNQVDAFDETIALLVPDARAPLSYDEQMLLAAAYFARDTPGDTAQALTASEAAQTLATNSVDLAAALASQAKAHLREDRSATARTLLYEALQHDPRNREACKRLTVDLLLAGEAQTALEVTTGLIARGARHSRVLAAHATALAQLGQHDAARDLIDLDRLLWQGTLATPDGWESLDAFNAALADELATHSGLRFERHGTSSVEGWRIDSLVAGGSPLAQQLVAAIVDAIRLRVDRLTGTDHPWVDALPQRAVVKSWCVITEGSGYETWHMHPFGWMSGVYYVAVPESVGQQDDNNGCLMLGLSDGFIGAEAASSVGHHLLRPQAGLLALFPSHTYHRTFPHRAQGKRICVAFDVEAA
jgi:tetratricopeptide (TPR) repeat protein